MNFRFIFYLSIIMILDMDVLLASDKVSINPVSSAETVIQPVYYSEDKRELKLILKGMEQCINISATLLQLTTRLFTEISEQQLLDCKNFTNDLNVSPFTLQFKFQTPKVRQETAFKWEFNTCKLDGNCKSIGEFVFKVVPENLLEPIENWSKEHTLFVQDKSGTLQNFLDKNSIEFIETKNLVSKNEQVISLIVVNDDSIELRKLLPKDMPQSVILFREYPTELPTIIDKTNGVIPLIDVQMPLIGRISDDVAVQNMLLKLFYMLPQTINVN